MLERVWRKGSPPSLLVGMRAGWPPWRPERKEAPRGTENRALGWPIFPCSSVGRQSAWNAGDPACNTGGLGAIPGSGRSPGEGHGDPLQYPCLEHPTDRGARCATVHGVTSVGHNLVIKPPPPPYNPAIPLLGIDPDKTKIQKIHPPHVHGSPIYSGQDVEITYMSINTRVHGEDVVHTSEECCSAPRWVTCCHLQHRGCSSRLSC